MGRLWDIVQRHIDEAPYPPSERTIARKLGVSPTTLGNWRDPKKLPSRENLEAIAKLAGVRYSVVLEAALYDTGYHEASGVKPAEELSSVEEIEEQRQTLLSALAELDSRDRNERAG